MSCFWQGIQRSLTVKDFKPYKEPNAVQFVPNLQTLVLFFKTHNCITTDITCNGEVCSQKMLEENKIDVNYTESLVFFEEERFTVSSTAALRIFSYLDGWERNLHLLSFFPCTFRDAFYLFIAKYRYKWFGRSEQCMVPTPEIRERFLVE